MIADSHRITHYIFHAFSIITGFGAFNTGLFYLKHYLCSTLLKIIHFSLTAIIRFKTEDLIKIMVQIIFNIRFRVYAFVISHPSFRMFIDFNEWLHLLAFSGLTDRGSASPKRIQKYKSSQINFAKFYNVSSINCHDHILCVTF